MNAHPQLYRVPGENGIWVLIFGDLLVFSVLFFTYFYARSENQLAFSTSQEHLNQTFGAINTLVLLTSSWFVALGVNAARRQLEKFAPLLFGAAFLCAVTFGVIKLCEYTQKIRQGFYINTNDFYMYYYMLTGIHLLHVIIGGGVLLAMMLFSTRLEAAPSKIRLLESGASFWHLVDVLWVVLFAIFYLIK